MQPITSFIRHMMLYCVFISCTCFVGCGKDDDASSSASLPTLGTLTMTKLHLASADFSASVTSDGGSALIQHGICWRAVQTPTDNDPRTLLGTGTGSFTGSATVLSNNTKYHVRAYATNAAGTAYSNEVTFTSIERSVLDADFNSYNVIEIGQTGAFWMMSNLMATKYRNGDAIATGLSSGQWTSTTSGGYALNTGVLPNNQVYGKLYNGHAIRDARGICPIGYHVATKAEYDALVQEANALPPIGNPGGALKGTVEWTSPNTGANDAMSFSAYAGGARDGITAALGGMGTSAFFWTQTTSTSGSMYRLVLTNGSAAATVSSGIMNDGYSCRCVRD